MTNTPLKHIAFFLPALNSGGAEKTFIMLAHHFAAQGIAVDLLVAKAEGAYLGRITDSITLTELGGSTIEGALWPLMRYIKSTKPDWIISALPGPNVMALLAKMLTRAPVKIMITQHHPFTHNAAASKKFRTKLRTMLAKRIFKNADRIVAVSLGVAEDLATAIALSPKRITTIYNPLDLSGINNAASKPPTHPWLSNKTQPVLIAAGRLAPPKDYITLLKALSQTKATRLLICGEGPDHASIMQTIITLKLEDRVQMLGFVENIESMVKAADALVLSSHHEGFGNVLIEAMALGTQIITTDCPYGPAEITQNGTYGHLVPIGDAPALAQAIDKTLQNPLKTKADLIAYAQKFSLEKVAAQYRDAMRTAPL